jgi:predicted GNAT family N-acyltransferase
MEAVEATAMVEGAEELWLNSRESAVGFYERLGYACDGEPFVSPLTGIPHRRMRKGLVADAPLSAPTS